ncbi:alpha/beta hydrolase family esterase [Seongchinamella unica]|uniref:alpha/beta hydrolase family esterase n=1 Tax=Seongchinamella unica TaxID=2547392 RepID=UPI001EEEAD8E|nr:hypothetical protein [Seongchinamella unica]
MGSKSGPSATVFVVAYPDGFDNHWNGCRKSASYTANTRGIDDVGFTRALVARLSADYGVDPGRVHLGGFSNGGNMVYRLALEAPELIAGGLALFQRADLTPLTISR